MIYLQRRQEESICHGCYYMDNQLLVRCDSGVNCPAGEDRVLKQVIPKRLLKEEAKVYEIHEGDILKVKINSKENLIDVVKFEDGKYIIGSFVLFFVIDQSEVIGNIHENPELLETT